MTSKDYVRLDRTLERYKNYINEEHNFQKDKFIKEDNRTPQQKLRSYLGKVVRRIFKILKANDIFMQKVDKKNIDIAAFMDT